MILTSFPPPVVEGDSRLSKRPLKLPERLEKRLLKDAEGLESSCPVDALGGQLKSEKVWQQACLVVSVSLAGVNSFSPELAD